MGETIIRIKIKAKGGVIIRIRTVRIIKGKVVNIGFNGYIGTWVLRIYRRYIGGYFYINIRN